MPDEQAATAEDDRRPTRPGTRRALASSPLPPRSASPPSEASSCGAASSRRRHERSARHRTSSTTPPLSGVDHSYTGGAEHFVGGGVAVFDCNDDGRPDLFFAGGADPAALYRNESAVGGELRFEQVTSPVTDLTAVTGAYPIDVDSDGTIDLAILRRGADVVLRGLGDCRFEDATGAFGLDGGDEWTTAFSAAWEGTNACRRSRSATTAHSTTTACADGRLVRPAPAGDAYDAPIALSPSYCTLSMLFSDWDRSGRRDLRVVERPELLRRRPRAAVADGRREPPREYTRRRRVAAVADLGHGHRQPGPDRRRSPRGVPDQPGRQQAADARNGSGATDVQGHGAEGGRHRASAVHAGGDALPSTAWHPEFEDVNNDGLVDLFVTKGNVEAQLDHAMRDPNNLLIGQPDGTFVEGAELAGIVGYERARGAAVVDLDLDGMLDLVVVNREANVTLWRNVGSGDAERPAPMGNWIAVRLEQPAPNVDAIGAWIEVKVGDRTVRGR
jgi:enediyne biosynthesis protein E4